MRLLAGLTCLKLLKYHLHNLMDGMSLLDAQLSCLIKRRKESLTFELASISH